MPVTPTKRPIKVCRGLGGGEISTDKWVRFFMPDYIPLPSPKGNARAEREGNQIGKPSEPTSKGLSMCIRQTITDKIINLMEAGTKATGPRWTGGTAGGLPRNARTGEPYHGINILLLWAEAAERHYATNQWLTYRQAEALGAQVRKGEKSVMCAYFSKVQTTAEEQNDDAEVARTYMLCKPFWLFNVAQIDGLPALCEEPTTATPITAIEEAEQLLTASGADTPAPVCCTCQVKHWPRRRWL